MAKTKVQAINGAQEILANATRTSQAMSWMMGKLGLSHNGKRDIYDVYGYPAEGNITFADMFAMAGRHGVAWRLTHGVAKTCWRDGFEVTSDPDEPEDPESQQLVDDLKVLFDRGMVRALERADILNRLGSFSVLLVGVPDNNKGKLSEPLGKANKNQLADVYFKPFAHDGVEVAKLVDDVTDRRYGLPLLYTLTPQARKGTKQVGNLTALTVHWSRVVHLNEQALDSDIEGAGYLEPIYNRIRDLDKTTGGSSEAYFRNARGKTAIEIDKDFASSLISNKPAKDDFDEAMEKFTNDQQDHIALAGAKAHALPTPQQSPLDTVKVAFFEIAAYTGYPLRILTGEGAGQLAGSEDQLAVNQITADRQRLINGPWALRVLQILAEAGMIKFEDDWHVVFPQQKAATEAQQVDIDGKKATALRDVATATSSIGGDAIDLESALGAVGLGDIKIDTDAPPPEPVDPVDPLEPEPDT